ncbi:peptidoglycan/LPS O-acetylase OafA/YrhL [Inquilinus ginsengisoli]|uniref:Peptidoglycan/LPS O-acetylase OafA/YrhL n=1 Tax=Inquilinus ginsengisoli TaxID=363840 RepID=A0ABU1JTF2_9PROT|nr:acyltransferase [Inquilinus ginsengisoli]MDR6290865.1 peptidoglycan/LPS O-acetylase OafA/YrhL [Inquilinus ginsengisoli]
MIPISVAKLQGVQILRGVAASMIVVLHCIYVVYSRAAPPDEVAARFGLFLGIGVDIFFVISGFIMMMISDQRKTGAGKFFVSRVCRIVPNYWFYTLLLAGVGVMVPSLLRAIDVNAATLLKSLFFIPFLRPNGEAQPILGVGWTLNYEMFFYLIFAGLISIGAWQRTVAMAGIFAVLFAIGLMSDEASLMRWFFGNTIVFTFVGGMVLYLIFRTWGRPGPMLSMVAFGTAIVILAPMVGVWNPSREARFLLWGIPSMLIVYAALGLPLMKQAAARFLEAVGDASYSLYLCHSLVITAVFFAWRALGVVPPWAFIPAAFVASLLAAFVAYRFVEIPLTEAARWMLEGRRRRAA